MTFQPFSSNFFHILECHFSWQGQYLVMLEGDSDVSAHCESGIMLRLSNMNVVVPLRFASHRLLRLMSITFHVLRLSNMNIVVLLCFSSHRLLRLMSMTFHVLRLPVVPHKAVAEVSRRGKL